MSTQDAFDRLKQKAKATKATSGTNQGQPKSVPLPPIYISSKLAAPPMPSSDLVRVYMVSIKPDSVPRLMYESSDISRSWDDIGACLIGDGWIDRPGLVIGCYVTFGSGGEYSSLDWVRQVVETDGALTIESWCFGLFRKPQSQPTLLTTWPPRVKRS